MTASGKVPESTYIDLPANPASEQLPYLFKSPADSSISLLGEAFLCKTYFPFC